MSAIPKSSWPGVKALLRSVYDQPDAEAVHAQIDRIVETLTEKLPTVRCVPRGREGGHPDVHRLPQGVLATDLVRQPQRAAQPGDPTPHRQGPDLPPPRRRHPPRRRGPGRATRRGGRAAPLPRTRAAQAVPDRPHRDRDRREGGDPDHRRRHQRLTPRRGITLGHHPCRLDPADARSCPIARRSGTSASSGVCAFERVLVGAV